MLTNVTMPKLGMSMKKGTVERWLVAEGQPVVKDEPLFELVTDKVNAVIDAPASGVLGRVVVPHGAERPVGGLLAVIGEAGDTFPSLEELAQTTAAAPTKTAGRSAKTAPAAARVPVPAGEVSASPAARRRAKELAVDIGLVPPSGPGKRLTTEDVEAFAAAGPVAVSLSPPDGPGIPF